MCFKSVHGIEAAAVLSLKNQSPSTLRWRLRVAVRNNRRSETTVGFDAPLGPMDSRRYREARRTFSQVDAHGQLPE